MATKWRGNILFSSEWMQCGDAFDLVDTPRAGFSSVREIIGKVRVCPMLKQ